MVNVLFSPGHITFPNQSYNRNHFSFLDYCLAKLWWPSEEKWHYSISLVWIFFFIYYFVLFFPLVWMLSEIPSKIALSVAPQYIYCCSQRFTYNVHSTIYFFFPFPPLSFLYRFNTTETWLPLGATGRAVPKFSIIGACHGFSQ